jgi:hypothetical protein
MNALCTDGCVHCDNILDRTACDLKMSYVQRHGKTVHSEIQEVNSQCTNAVMRKLKEAVDYDCTVSTQ